MSNEFEKCYKACEEFGFDPRITAEMLWNEGYRIGRRRWYWGPSWFVSFQGWVNTQLLKLRGDSAERSGHPSSAIQ